MDLRWLFEWVEKSAHTLRQQDTRRMTNDDEPGDPIKVVLAWARSRAQSREDMIVRLNALYDQTGWTIAQYEEWTARTGRAGKRDTIGYDRASNLAKEAIPYAESWWLSGTARLTPVTDPVELHVKQLAAMIDWSSSGLHQTPEQALDWLRLLQEREKDVCESFAMHMERTYPNVPISLDHAVTLVPEARAALIQRAIEPPRDLLQSIATSETARQQGEHDGRSSTVDTIEEAQEEQELADFRELDEAYGRSFGPDEEEYQRPNPAVVHPEHYNAHPASIETWDVTEHMPANIAAAMKYQWRVGLKDSNDPIQELGKAIQYLQREQLKILRLRAGIVHRHYGTDRDIADPGPGGYQAVTEDTRTWPSFQPVEHRTSRRTPQNGKNPYGDVA